MLKGYEPFRLINVTSDNKEKLIEECEKILNMNLFNPLENKKIGYTEKKLNK